MTSGTPDDRTRSAASRPSERPDLSALLVSAVVVAVAVGCLAGTVAAATTVVGFEEFDEGTELADQYREQGILFELQDGQEAGAIVGRCGSASNYCAAARNGERVAITPPDPGVESLDREPLVATFTEPQQEVRLYVKAWEVDGLQRAELVARDASGEVVGGSSVEFDPADDEWHRIAVSTSSAEISEVTLTLADAAEPQEPHNHLLVDDLTFRRNEPPTPAFDYSPENPTAGESITFDASESSDPDGEIGAYRWDFDGDRLIDDTGPTPTYTFAVPDTYPVMLAVEDDSGTVRTVTRDVTVGAEPVARCSVSETDMERDERVTIDASASTDAERVLFDVDGDGIYERANEGDLTETVSYAEPGSVTPAVRAEAGELSDTRSCPTIRVNRPPTAAIATAAGTPSVGEPIAFDASGSSDTDGEVVEYRWDFDGDGSPDRTTEEPRTEYTFEEGGTHRVSVTVVDDHGAVARAETSIRVNRRPRATFGYAPETVRIDYPYPDYEYDYAPVDDPTVGEPIAFDASGSSDTDGEIVEYRWDFDGDGSPDRTTDSSRTEYTFEEGGSHAVSLVAVDDQGGVARAETSVRVGEPTVPGPGSDVFVGVIGGGAAMLALRQRPRPNGPDGPDGENGDEGDGEDGGEDEENRPPDAKIEFVPHEAVPGRPVAFDGSDSSDPDSDDHIVSYRWTVDGETSSMAPRFVHVFPVAREYDVELTVIDTHGATDTQTETITVEEPEGELVLDRVHPSPEDGDGSLDGEYVVFENAGERRVDLGGWTVRDAAAAEGRVVGGDHAFEFPEGFDLDPGRTVTVHTGPEPEEGKPDGVEEDGEGRHLYGGKDRAVWDDRTDVVVVEDDGGHPVMAVRYERTGPGEYAFEDLDVEILQHWFPDVVVSSRGEAPAVSVDVDVDTGDLVPSAVSSTLGLVAGALLLRGPRRFLRSWATIAGFFLLSSVSWGVSTWAGIVSRSIGVLLPFVLLPATVSVLLVGGVAVSLWLAVSTLWRRGT